MKIRTQILTLVVVLLFLMGVASAVGISRINYIGREIERVTESDMPLMEALTRVMTLSLQQSVNFERALRFGTQAHPRDPSLTIPIREAKAEFDRLRELVRQALTDGRRVLSEAGSDEQFEKLQYQFSKIEEAYSRYETQGASILNLLARNQTKEAKIESLSITIDEERLRRTLATFSEEVEAVKEASAKRAQRTRTIAAQSMVAITGVGLLVGLVLAINVTWSITTPLNVAVKLAQRIAQGDKSAVAVQGYGGEVGQLLATMARMQEAIRESEHALEQRAEELARSNQELEQFAYVASHDLQEPLRMVSLYVQLIGSDYQQLFDEDAHEYMRLIVEATGRMQLMIQDILTYSRVRSSKKELHSCDLNPVIDAALDNLKHTVEESNAVIRTGTLPLVKGDSSQLIQLFQNLIGNAIKFRETKNPEVWIEGTREGDFIHVKVIDNGIGIEQQYLQRIFHIFQRLHPSSRYPGTGIGLAICKRIVEQHGGKIWVESTVGVGSVFHFTLPSA